MNIVETVTESPTQVATEVVFEDAIRWNVKCEAAGCGNVITVPKRTYQPIDYGTPDNVRKVEATAPGARWCALHGPAAS